MRAARQILIFLVVVIGIVLLLSLVFGGKKQSSTTKNATSSLAVTDYLNKDSQVVSITDGPINGDDTHRSIRISVDRDTRTMDVIQGYQGKVIASKSYVNNQKAYDEFLHALERASFGKTRKTSFASEDGICATGRRFVFELFENGKSVSRTWTANCQKGNTIAAPDRITKLFRNQITDYEELIKGQTF